MISCVFNKSWWFCRQVIEWRFYFKGDKGVFKQPKAFLTVLLATSLAASSAEAVVACKLWKLAATG
jgi:hypothetical protein